MALVNGYRFQRRFKITKTDDFSSVFNFRKRISGRYLAIHYQPNNLCWARLGMIVGKKTVRLSVNRNYMKRIIRELFRTQTDQLPNVDLVIRMQKPFGRVDYPLIQQEFIELLSKLRRHTAQPGES